MFGNILGSGVVWSDGEQCQRPWGRYLYVNPHYRRACDFLPSVADSNQHSDGISLHLPIDTNQLSLMVYLSHLIFSHPLSDLMQLTTVSVVSRYLLVVIPHRYWFIGHCAVFLCHACFLATVAGILGSMCVCVCVMIVGAAYKAGARRTAEDERMMEELLVQVMQQP